MAPGSPRVRRRWRLVRARRDAVPASLRTVGRAPRRGRVAPHAARWWRVGTVVLVVAIALGWVLLGTSVLGVRQVEITGTRITDAEQVRQAASVAIGTPLARVDTDAVARRVRSLPPVADVAVHRSWPGTLVIAVSERVAVAVAAVDGAFVLLDAQGVVFHTVSKRPDGVALIEVARPGPDDPATQAALRVVAALTEPLRARLRVLVAPTPRDLRLKLAGETTVVWGDAENSETKARAATALLARTRGKTIDVSAPDVVTVTALSRLAAGTIVSGRGAIIERHAAAVAWLRSDGRIRSELAS